MHDTGLRFQEKSITGNLLSIHEHIIPSGTLGIQPYRLQIACQYLEIPFKSGLDIRSVRDIGEHNVALVGIDASAAALSAEKIDSLFLAVRHVDLRLHNLIPSENHRRRHLPHKESVLVPVSRQQLVQMSGHVFFHGQVKDQTTFRRRIR